MTLITRSYIFLIILLSIFIFSFKLFSDYKKLNNLYIKGLSASSKIENFSNVIYDSLRNNDYQKAEAVAETIPETLKSFKLEYLTKEEFHRFIIIKLSFIRVSKLLKGYTEGRSFDRASLNQIHHELKKILTIEDEFNKSFNNRMERLRNAKNNILIIIYVTIGFIIAIVFTGFYYYSIKPILYLTSQIQAVKKGKINNIVPYRSKDEIGNLSIFIFQVLHELNQSTDNILRRFEMQRATTMILKALQQAEDIEFFLKKVLDIVLSLKCYNILQKGAIFIVDEFDSKRLLLKVCKNFPPEQKQKCSQVPIGKCLCGKAAESGKVLHCSNVNEDHEIKHEGMHPHGHYCVPIKQKEQLLGILTLYLPGHYGEKERDIERDTEFLESISIIIAESMGMLKLAEKEHLITRAIEESGEGIIIANKNKIIEYVNPTIEKITGYSKEEFIKRNLLDKMSLRGIKYDDIEKIIDRQGWTEILAKRKDGKEYYEHLSIMPVKSKNEKNIKYVSISRDVTKEKSLEDQLKQAQKMEVIGRLAGGVAHDFNNYLTAIVGYGELALMKMDSDTPAVRDIERLIEAGQKATSVTKQLLTFSRKRAVTLEVIDLNNTIHGMSKILNQLLGENIVLEVLTETELWKVKADKNQIEQIIANLAINAKDAMPEGGKLIIRTQNIGNESMDIMRYPVSVNCDHILLSVTDTGCGMSDETKKHIFEPFFTTKEGTHGTGLGLSIVYSMVQQVSGYIDVDTCINKGTTFYIYLPRTNESITAQEEVKKASLKLPHGNQLILLVEDQSEVRDYVREILKQIGYTVIEAENGCAALKLWHDYKERIALVLTDVVMPKMNGREFVEKVRQDQPNVKVIYMSGYTDTNLSEKDYADRRNRFVEKPFTGSRLAHEVKDLLSSAIIEPDLEQHPL